MKTYSETIDFLYSQLPMFQRSGAKALKKDLTNIKQLCERLGNPQDKLKFVHVAGTNGKGTISHMVASVLQTSGLEVGLYTSPHYEDFRERIKINGTFISEKYIIEWVNSNQGLFHEVRPSFFEITVALAFSYFAYRKVGIVVLETGLGGRLDSTNIVEPLLSVITNISLDHQAMLGNSIYEIANEKAGIIKTKTPIVIGRHQVECDGVFLNKSHELNSPISWASLKWETSNLNNGVTQLNSDKSSILLQPLCNESPFFLENITTTLQVIAVLCDLDQLEWNSKLINTAITNYRTLTNYVGRWQILSDKPLIIVDSAHNEDALSKVVKRLKEIAFRDLHLVLGFVKEKDIRSILKLFPQNAYFHFVKADIPRAMNLDEVENEAALMGLSYTISPSVIDGIQAAHNIANDTDLIYVGGSSFVVGEALSGVK